MSTDKKVLIVSKDKGAVSRDLGDIVLTFDIEVLPSVPPDFDKDYDAVVLYDLPEDISLLMQNYKVPVVALDRPAESTRLPGYERAIGAISRDNQVSRLNELIQQKDDTQAAWSSVLDALKTRLRSSDIISKVTEIAAQKPGMTLFDAFAHYVENDAKLLDETKVIDKNTDPRLVSFRRARIMLIKHLEAYDEDFGKPNGIFFRQEAEKNLDEFLQHAQERRQLLGIRELSGPSVESGSQFLYFDVVAAKKDKPDFGFLKRVRDRDGVSHEAIAQVIYHDAKRYNREGLETLLRIPDTKPPITRGDESYLLRQVIYGPDLENLFLYLRKGITKDSARKNWMRSFRNICVYHVFRCLNEWQERSPDATVHGISDGADDIVAHMQRNLYRAFDTFSRAQPPSETEKELWKKCLALYNKEDMGLNKSTTRRHIDLSTTNIKWHTGSRKAPSLESLSELIESGNWKTMEDSSKKRIENRIWFVDTGHTYVHQDEDFFHIACSYALHEEHNSHGEKQTAQDKLKTIEDYYRRFNGFRGRGRMKPAHPSYWLHGFYRNVVSGHLNFGKYERDKENLPLARARHTHRMELAEAFAAEGAKYLAIPLEAERAVPATVSPDALLAVIKDCEQKVQAEEFMGLRSTYSTVKNVACMRGLQYFAEKYGRIKPQPPILPASQPAGQ